MIERDGEELIWPPGNVERAWLTITINDMVKITVFFEPKPHDERRARLISITLIAAGRFFIVRFTRPIREQAERVVPKRIDFDCLAATWSNNPIPHLCVHPGQLITFLAL